MTVPPRERCASKYCISGGSVSAMLAPASRMVVACGMSFERKRQPAIESERHGRRRGARRHAEAAVVVDVRRAERDARELARAGRPSRWSASRRRTRRPCRGRDGAWISENRRAMRSSASSQVAGTSGLPRSPSSRTSGVRSRSRCVSVSGADQPFTHNVPLLTGNATSPVTVRPGGALPSGECRTAERSTGNASPWWPHHAGDTEQETHHGLFAEMCDFRPFSRFFGRGWRRRCDDLVGEPPEGTRSSRRRRAAAARSGDLSVFVMHSDVIIVFHFYLQISDKRCARGRSNGSSDSSGAAAGSGPVRPPLRTRRLRRRVRRQHQGRALARRRRARAAGPHQPPAPRARAAAKPTPATAPAS